jgi:SNF2 family DNA or RNA helicase
MTAVLHGTWLADQRRLFLWGEVAERASRRGRQSKSAAHPFQLPADALHARLSRLPSSGAVPPERELTIWLPSAGGEPLPLRELRAAGVEAPKGEPALAPWKVHGLLLSPVQAVELLLSLGKAHDVGADLQAWRVAALLMLELIVGQQLMPTLGRDNGRFRAEWQPRPAPATARRIGDLARAMPPICRAVVEDPADAPEPRALIDAFLRATSDTLIRLLAFQDRTLAAKANRRQSPPPTHGELWLSAMLAPDPTLALYGRGAEELYQEWQTWAGQEEVAGDSNFRITFRLEPPEDGSEQWVLAYFLQAADDPSLLVPVAQLWRERGQEFRYLDRRFERPQERLLKGLAFAARLVPPIDRSLRERAPERATMNVTEAFAFLKEAAGLLEQSGFGVLLPAWWGGAGRLRARARASVGKQQQQRRGDNAGRISFQSMVNFRWELSIGGQPITQAEFERLVALKQPLVRVRGEWVALDPDQIRQAIALFQKVGTMSMVEALQMRLGGSAPELPPGIAFDGIDAEGELGEMLRGLDEQQRLEELPQPAGFQGTLRPYQLRGFSWMTFMRRFGLGACLADDMGLGKSPQTIALLLHERATAPDLGPTLLVCPTSVIGNWQRELARFSPELRVLAHQGTDRLRGEELARVAADYDVVITSYPLLARDRDTLAAIDWRIAVLDEAQNIKNSETRQAQAARALRSQARVALTGTPVENRLTELWSIMSFLNPGYLGGEAEFRRSFARPIERAGDSEAAAHLRQLTGPFILRRLKSDPTIISDLPDKIEMKVFVPLTQEQATLYEATVRDALAQIQSADDEGEQTRRRGLVLAMLTRLKQVCNHPAHLLKDGSPLDGRSGKLDRLDEMLEEVLAADDRALIFTQFAEMGELLQGHLTRRLGAETLFLHGGTPAKERDGMVRRFQAPEGPRLFILSLKAGGTGLNLTNASHVFHFDRWWNPAVEDQATDRAFRIGQTRNVQVHKFVCGGTLEEKIDAMIEGKRALAAQVLGAGEGWITELSTDQLRELVALRREEISDERGGE